MNRLSRLRIPFPRYYATVQRNPSFKTVQTSDVAFFEKVLGPTHVLQASKGEDLTSYNQDWLKIYHGKSQLVLFPHTTEQVSTILRHCNSHHIAVVPQGGNTGLVGGSVPVHDEVVISMSRMNTIEDINEEIGFITCQPGVILKVLDDHVANFGRIVPLDMGSKGSCQIGGCLSTNAGGTRLMRYGSLRGNTLALKVVLADGRIIDCSAPLRKDNTGVDLKQWFIGTEGTLGIITKATLYCPVRPSSVHVAMFGCETVEKLIECFKAAQVHLGEIISAFELMDDMSMQCVEENLHLQKPFQDSHRYYALVETSGSNKGHDSEKLHAFNEFLLKKGLVSDGVVAQDIAQARSLWNLREMCAEGFMRQAEWVLMDVAVAMLSRDMPALMNHLESHRQNNNNAHQLATFGHLGVGNLHLNFVSKKFEPSVKASIEPYVYAWLKENGGSISAEHGLGQMKAPFLAYSKSPQAIGLMHNFKTMLDPHGILNPYKFLPPQSHTSHIR